MRELFAEKFVLGAYQREYEWGPTQATQMFEDLKQAFERREGGSVDYFLGPIVTRKNPKTGTPALVDGQQRITTLAILIAAIRYAIKHPESFVAQEAQQEDVTPKTGPDPSWKRVRIRDPLFTRVKLGGDQFPAVFSDPEREGVITLLSESGVDRKAVLDQLERANRTRAAVPLELRLQEVFVRILENLSESLDFTALPDFLRWIADRVVAVEVSTGKSQSEFVIFDRMNARGLPLQPMNLLYNHVNTSSALLPDETKSGLLSTMKAVAATIQEEGGREDLAFVKAWLLARLIDMPQTRYVGASARDALKKLPIDKISDAPVSYALSDEATKRRLYLHDPVEFTHQHWAVYGREYARARRAYRVFDPNLESLWLVSQTNLEADLDLFDEVLLIAACRAGSENNGPRMKVAAQFLENLAARLAWYKLSTRSRAQEHRFSLKHLVMRAACAIRDVQSPETIATILAGMLEDVTLDFENEPVLTPAKAPLMRMLLARLTAHMDTWLPDNITGQRYLPGSWFANYTQTKGKLRFDIEHMLPRPFRVGRSDNQTYPEGHRFRDENTYASRRQSIGALLLLTIDANRSLSDTPYRQKFERYRNHNSNGLIATLSGNENLPTAMKQQLDRIEARFPDAKTLSAEIITERVSALRKIAKDVWSADAIHAVARQ